MRCVSCWRFLLLFGVLGATQASSPQWTMVCKGDVADFFYDAASLKRTPDGIVQVAVKHVTTMNVARTVEASSLDSCRGFEDLLQNLKRPNAGEKEAAYVVELKELNCRTNEVRRLVTTYFGTHDDVLCRDDRTDGEVKWDKISAKSCDTPLYEALCN